MFFNLLSSLFKSIITISYNYDHHLNTYQSSLQDIPMLDADSSFYFLSINCDSQTDHYRFIAVGVVG